jgi:hypothetical protein
VSKAVNSRGYAKTGRRPANHPSGAWRGNQERKEKPVDVTPDWAINRNLLPKKPPGRR